MKQVLFTLFFISISIFTNAQEFNTPQTITISELKARFTGNSDTLYVVNFWATWCKPCVEEMPVIENIPSKINNIPVKVLLVSLDFKNQIDKQLIPFIADNYIMNEVLVLDENDPNEWIPKVNKKWSGAIPACWLTYRNNQIFHEGQVNPDLINELLLKSIK